MAEDLPNNFRDVGESINAAAGCCLIVPGRLFRSGEFENTEFISSYRIQTVVSLRRRPDPVLSGVCMLNVAPEQTMNNYSYEEPVFRRWLSSLAMTLSEVEYPVLLHCSAGKDRTGVAVALLLKSLGITNEHILGDYMKSDGELYPESLSAVLNAPGLAGTFSTSIPVLRNNLVANNLESNP